MKKIVYLGKDPFAIVDKIPGDFLIVDYEDYCENPFHQPIYYYGGDEKPMDLLPPGSLIYFEKKLVPDFSKYRHLHFVSDLSQKIPKYKKIGLKGERKHVDAFVEEFCKGHTTSIKLLGDYWTRRAYREEQREEKYSTFTSQLSFSLEGNFILSFDESLCEVTLYFWKNQLQELYQWKEKNREEPLFVFCEGKKALEKAKTVLRGNFLLRKRSMKRNWEEVLKIP